MTIRSTAALAATRSMATTTRMRAVRPRSLNWDAQGADNTNLEGGFTQNTGDMDVTVSFDDGGDSEPLLRVESTDTIYTDTGEPFDSNSSGYLYGDNDATSTTRISFSGAERSGFGNEVSKVQFRISDIDWGSSNHTDIVTVNAFDANGDPVTVVISPDGADTVSGNTITASTSGESQADAAGSALITIEGPVSSIEIEYSNAQSGTQAVWISDVHFVTIPPVDGNDSINGGAGRDFIDGEGGEDTIDGGNSADTILGGAGDDVIVDSGGSGSADSIDGGTGNDSIDAGHGNDTIIGGDGDDTMTGNRGVDIYDGGAGDDVMYLSEGDTAVGGDGDDLFVLTDLGETGSSTISITGGEGDETDGDTLQLSPDVSYSDITFTNTDDNAGGLSGNFAMSDGTIVTFTEIENIICFTPGAQILTEHGLRAIETLRVGDRVVTRDNGLQPIRWLGMRTVAGQGRFAPVQIARHVITNATRPLLVSPQHRILFSGYQAELLFGTSEVLVAAKHLIDGCDVRQIEQTHVTYVHLMLDAHEVIYADGTATESFHAGDVGLSALSDASRDEMFAIFPELRSNPNAHGRTARRCLKRREAQLLNAYDHSARAVA
ncbi:Hint domain-containing protein [Roseovarius pelagicus]|uniref:Hint domain-containing protein n=2 Tax=Roseovarius pelagicus TaxID=2980108 RepID=A0ABY6DHS6_9RHOB|nr:Hint domain-containing protein [Roseovarius pelagicus]UXX85095.1 Hint domain-containing protein [Roseovarius pelagicus]